MRDVLAFFFTPPMRWSTIAFLVLTPLGLLSMGGTGAGVTFAVDPVLRRLIGTGIYEQTGDAAWPRMILLGMLFPVGILLAGWLDTLWAAKEWMLPLRVAAYAATAWVWTLALGAALAKHQF